MPLVTRYAGFPVIANPGGIRGCGLGRGIVFQNCSANVAGSIAGGAGPAPALHAGRLTVDIHAVIVAFIPDGVPIAKHGPVGPFATYCWSGGGGGAGLFCTPVVWAGLAGVPGLWTM